VDINLIPFSMVDHVDILKDGASAVYGSDAISGVVNFFLIHKFRGLEIGATYGNTNMELPTRWVSGRHGLKLAREMTRPTSFVVADFWERLGGVFSRDARHLFQTASSYPSVALTTAAGNEPGRVQGRRLLPRMFFAPAGPTQFGVNSPPPHSAPNAAHSPFYKSPFAVNPNAYPGAPGILNPNGFNGVVPQTGTDYKGGGDYFFFNFAAFTPALPPGDRQVVLRLFYPRYLRQIPDGIWRF